MVDTFYCGAVSRFGAPETKVEYNTFTRFSFFFLFYLTASCTANLSLNTDKIPVHGHEWEYCFHSIVGLSGEMR